MRRKNHSRLIHRHQKVRGLFALKRERKRTIFQVSLFPTMAVRKRPARHFPAVPQIRRRLAWPAVAGRLEQLFDDFSGVLRRGGDRFGLYDHCRSRCAPLTLVIGRGSFLFMGAANLVSHLIWGDGTLRLFPPLGSTKAELCEWSCLKPTRTGRWCLKLLHARDQDRFSRLLTLFFHI